MRETSAWSEVVRYQGVVVESPALSFTPTGKAVCNMYVDTDDERLTVVTWEELAEKVSQYIKLEDRVEVYGQKKTRWWTNSDGERVSREEVNARRVRVVERVEYLDYCCLSCIHWEADCLAGCYNAFGGFEDRKLCQVIDGACVTRSSDGGLMNRDCWERK